MRIETADIDRIKNIDQFNKAVDMVIDESKLMDCDEYGAKRIGLVFDIDPSIGDYIDYNATHVQGEYGMPYEMFTHVQHTGSKSTLTWIVTGLPLPLKEVQDIYENYKKSTMNVKKSKDGFFDALASMKGDEEDSMFDMLSSKPKTKAKSSFFADFGIKDKADSGKPSARIKQNGNTEDT
jgi:hypothetical protein